MPLLAGLVMTAGTMASIVYVVSGSVAGDHAHFWRGAAIWGLSMLLAGLIAA